MTNYAMKGACLARGLETQASRSTGFRTSLRQLISHLDESQQAYDKIAVDDPGTKKSTRETVRKCWLWIMPNSATRIIG